MASFRSRLKAAETRQESQGDPIDAVFLVADDAWPAGEARISRSGRLATVRVSTESLGAESLAIASALVIVPSSVIRTAMMSTTRAVKVYVGLDPDRL